MNGRPGLLSIRRVARDGLFELEKLAWDYLVHPF
jgi:hypothetical protein